MANVQAIGTGFYIGADGREHWVNVGEWYPDSSEAVTRCPSCFDL